ncbi:hypothetical protein [Streptomyces halstedii]|uniref:Uncharacterized protein n=1 Tax=Streptomyces halstedii TaxID=1944 RepID=A0A6N9UDJ7_STRHA|nr:hypothetical protein [Streptomyces halstedii]NEA20662.1 hypothetical protein [Streptomyces halstedii]
MSSPKALDRTADRRRGTGELHQALAPLLPDDDSVLLIPAARHKEQARLEAEIFLGLRAVGGLSAHPLGIVRLRPEEDRLTIRVTDTPYVVMCWADLLLPRSTGEPSGDPRDLISGVPGLRYHRDHGGIHLHRPGMPTQITLTGFPARWWDRITDRMHRDYDGHLLQPHPGWTPDERAAYDADSGWPFPPGSVFSPLLRRIRATAGPGTVNSTDAWSSGGGYRMEATDGPPCPELIRLLGDGPTGAGWQVTHKRCTCRCDHEHDSCTVDFLDPATGIAVRYSNGRWGRTADKSYELRMAELNAKAFE